MGGAGVMGDVGERLLNDAIGGNLDRGGQGREFVWRADRNVEPVRGVRRVTFRGVANRAEQTQLIQSRRAQVVDEAPDLGEGCFYVRLEFRKKRVRRFGVLIVEHPRRAHFEALRGEPGTEAVVQVAAQAAALLLPCGDEELARALQVGREPHGFAVEGYRVDGDCPSGAPDPRAARRPPA